MRSPLAASLLAALFLSACAGIQPTFDYDKSYAFDEIKSFATAPRPATGRANAIVSDMTHERIDDSIVDKLKSMGLKHVGQVGNPDVVVSYHLMTKSKQDLSDYNTKRGYECWRCKPMPETEAQVILDTQSTEIVDTQGALIVDTQGTMIIDMHDSKSDKSVWRAVATKRIEPKRTPAKRRKMVQKVIDAMFADFPPGTLQK